MPRDVELSPPGDDSFPLHVFDLLGVEPRVFEERIGGSVLVTKHEPQNGPITLATAGVARLSTDSGKRVEFAIEVLEHQIGAAWIALRLTCDDVAVNRRVPPMHTPWRNSEPFLTDTAITAIIATESRWGSSFDEVRNNQGELEGHLVTLRMLTTAEADVVQEIGWEAFISAVGSYDALIDVERKDHANTDRFTR